MIHSVLVCGLSSCPVAGAYGSVCITVPRLTPFPYTGEDMIARPMIVLPTCFLRRSMASLAVINVAFSSSTSLRMTLLSFLISPNRIVVVVSFSRLWVTIFANIRTPYIFCFRLNVFRHRSLKVRKVTSILAAIVTIR